MAQFEAVGPKALPVLPLTLLGQAAHQGRLRAGLTTST